MLGKRGCSLHFSRESTADQVSRQCFHLTYSSFTDFLDVISELLLPAQQVDYGSLLVDGRDPVFPCHQLVAVELWHSGAFRFIVGVLRELRTQQDKAQEIWCYLRCFRSQRYMSALHSPSKLTVVAFLRYGLSFEYRTSPLLNRYLPLLIPNSADDLRYRMRPVPASMFSPLT